MRDVVVAAFVSLDGVMQAPGGPPEDPTGGFAHGGWTVPFWDEAMGQFMGDMFAAPFDLLLGRRTYEIFAAHWPYADASDPIAGRFTAAAKHVATRSGALPIPWANAAPLPGEAADAVAALKQGEGPRLLTQGSSVLVQALLARDLVDEIRLLTFPVLLGRGKRLFGPDSAPRTLALAGSAVSSTGVTMATWRRAGPVETGTFELPEPSAAELARRERLRAEGTV